MYEFANRTNAYSFITLFFIVWAVYAFNPFHAELQEIGIEWDLYALFICAGPFSLLGPNIVFTVLCLLWDQTYKKAMQLLVEKILYWLVLVTTASLSLYYLFSLVYLTYTKWSLLPAVNGCVS